MRSRRQRTGLKTSYRMRRGVMSATADDPGAEPLSINNEEGPERAAGAARKFRLTMEIPFFCMFFAASISGAVVNNMLLDRACRLSLGYNSSMCSELQQRNSSSDVKELESKVQAVTTLVLMVKQVLEGVVPAILSLFLGVWSNTHGRKPLFIWPLLGYALSTIMVTAYSLLADVSAWWFVVTSIPYSLGGGSSALFTGAFCYLSDISTQDNRSFRLAMLEGSLFVGSILGSLASPYTVVALGTPLLLLFTSCFTVTAYLYANLCIEESIVDAVPGGLRSVLDPSLVSDMLRTCFKRRPDFERAVIFLLVISNSTGIFILYGLFNIDYLYAREKLSWNLQQYSVFSAVNTVVMVAGLAAGVGVCQKMLKWSDAVMTLVAYASCAIEMAIRAMATAATSWLMYLSSVVSLLRGLSSPLIRSLISKRVSAEDVAKVFALMSALEAILPVLSPLVYNTLYKYTLATMPEAVYLMTMAIYGACFLMVAVAQYLMVRYPQQQYSQLER